MLLEELTWSKIFIGKLSIWNQWGAEIRCLHVQHNCKGLRRCEVVANGIKKKNQTGYAVGCVSPNTIAWSSLINACAHAGLVDQGNKMLEESLGGDYSNSEEMTNSS